MDGGCKGRWCLKVTRLFICWLQLIDHIVKKNHHMLRAMSSGSSKQNIVRKGQLLEDKYRWLNDTGGHGKSWCSCNVVTECVCYCVTVCEIFIMWSVDSVVWSWSLHRNITTSQTKQWKYQQVQPFSLTKDFVSELNIWIESTLGLTTEESRRTS